MMLSAALVSLALTVSVSARPLGYIRYPRAALDTGSCGSPEIQFADGLDGRNEPSFQAVDQQSFPHGSALNIGVISSFVCQQLNDKCKAAAATLSACASAQAAAAKATGGAAADAFNAALGIQSNFASGAASGANSTASAAANSTANAGANSTASDASGSSNDTCPPATTVTVTAAAASVTATANPATNSSSDAAASNSTASDSAAAASNATASDASGAAANSTGAATGSTLDFGSCSNPAIEFGPAFDGRKATENSFEPQDKTSINHDSALNIDIITQATCDQLKDTCKAPAATLAACAQGQKDADAQAKGTGAQADAFNAALGITTDFATTPAAPGGGVATAAQAAAANTPSIGSCTDPSISFGIFDGRTEDSFEPTNQADFSHSSALNINIITQFICDTFVNKCNANQAATDSCAAAKLAVNGLTGQAAADAFNAAVLKPAA